MKKIMFPVLSVALMVGCRSVADGIVVPFTVHARGIPAEKIKLVNEKEKELFENEILSFSPIKNTVFTKCQIYFASVITRPHIRKPPFCIAVPNGSSIALMLKGDLVFINEIIKNENLKLNDMKKAKIQKLLKDVFYFNQGWNVKMIDSENDLKYDLDSEKDIKWKAEFEKQLAKEIKPISIVKKDNQGFVEYYFISDQDIVKRTLTLNQNCTIVPGSIKDKIVGKGMAKGPGSILDYF